MSVKIEECDQKSLEEIPFWAVTEEDPEETFLSATSIDEAIEEWKENVEDDPEAVFDIDGFGRFHLLRWNSKKP